MKENDTLSMFNHACAFLDCAEYCERESSNIEYRTRSHFVSGIVNSAFACEVFIKTLLVLQGMQEKGHKLKTLWSTLKENDSETALFVEQRMQEVFNSVNENMFDELLNNISDAFEYYRYIYEKESSDINPQYLRFFRILLRDACCKKLHNKPWNEYKKGNLL